MSLARKRVDGVGFHTLRRVGALLAALGLVTALALVLRDIVGTVGDPTRVDLVAIGSMLAATVAWRFLTERGVLWLAGLGAAVALLGYYVAVPSGQGVWVLLDGTVELLTGRSVLWIVAVERWVLLFTPVPVFLTWVLALERRYVWSATVGVGALSLFALTGDAGRVVTVFGIATAGVLVGLGDVLRQAESAVAAEHLVVALAVVVVAPFLVLVVPGEAAGPLGLGGDGGTTTMEENVVGADERLDIVGSVDQDPEVRFLVEGDQPRYWRTGSYDRYTGDGWVRSGEAGEGSLASAPTTATYEVTAQTDLDRLPAPWRAVGVDGVDDRLQVAPDGAPALDGRLDAGETVSVEVAQPAWSSTELAAADGTAPEEITERYTQMPADTPDRVAELTGQIVASADSPYEQATVVEEWLRTNRGYSLDVDRPDGDIVDAFLFEMEEGYCTYHATAMVGMLRSVDVPARLAVGYSVGEPVEDDTWAVRGTNSHAWVEVYVPEHGWVQFDPTPSDPRTDTEEAAVDGPVTSVTLDDGADGRDNSEDRNATSDGTDTDSFEGLDPGEVIGDPQGGIDLEEELGIGETAEQEATDGDESDDPDGPDEDSDDSRPGLSVDPGDIDPPSGTTTLLSASAVQQALVGLLAAAGLAVGLRRLSLPGLVRRELRVRFQRRRDPRTDIERAHDRLLLVLAKRHRPRRQGETTRQYLDAVDACAEARRVATLRERARFAGEVSPAAADEAVELVETVRKG